MPRNRVVKKYKSEFQAGLYRALTQVYTYVCGSLRIVEEDTVVNLDKGEASHHFELVQLTGPAKDNSKLSGILNALTRFDIANKGHWTDQGLPSVLVVQTMAGDPSITRADVNKAKPGFCRNYLVAEMAKNPQTKDLKSYGQGSDKRNSNHQGV